jgi:hypothetical protein
MTHRVGSSPAGGTIFEGECKMHTDWFSIGIAIVFAVGMTLVIVVIKRSEKRLHKRENLD